MSQSPDVLDTMIGMGAGSADPEAARRHYDVGQKALAEGDRPAAIEAFRAAVRLDSDAEYVFQLALNLDLAGEEDESVALYEQICGRERPHINALLNLAVVYEDRGDIGRAEKCLRQILDTMPNHERARMFMKDASTTSARSAADRFSEIARRRGGVIRSSSK